MTAQIGIFNKKAIALATDSAVTLMAGKRLKVFNTAEKLFELIPGVPIGIMIYNNAEFMSIPYEVLIKQYKKEVGNIRLNTLEEYNNSFLQFLRTNTFITEINERVAIRQAAESYFHKIIDSTLEKIEEVQIQRALTKGEMNEILMNQLKEYNEYLIKEGIHFEFEDIYNNQELEPFKDEILEMIESNAGTLEEEQQEFALKTLLLAICSNDFHENYTGVVIAGFGETEVFAKSYETIIEFRFKGSLKCESVPNTEVSVTESAAIKAYAQSDMAENIYRRDKSKSK
nr:hypothetical protein [uncultured Aminipila sp.]